MKFIFCHQNFTTLKLFENLSFLNFLCRKNLDSNVMKFQGFGILEIQRKLISSIIFWNVFKSHFRKIIRY